MEKYLLFSSGGGSADPLNFDKTEMGLWPASSFLGLRASSARTIDLFFKAHQEGDFFTHDKVVLSIKNGTHIAVAKAITNTIFNSSNGVISIADMDNGRYIDNNIFNCEITYAIKEDLL